VTLVFKRRKGEAVRIGDCLVTVAELSPSVCKLVIDAPANIVVWRAELGQVKPFAKKPPEGGAA
jgi:sRNA-binding carbon storage regulator CsrA